MDEVNNTDLFYSYLSLLHLGCYHVCYKHINVQDLKTLIRGTVVN